MPEVYDPAIDGGGRGFRSRRRRKRKLSGGVNRSRRAPNSAPHLVPNSVRKPHNPTKDQSHDDSSKTAPKTLVPTINSTINSTINNTINNTDNSNRHDHAPPEFCDEAHAMRSGEKTNDDAKKGASVSSPLPVRDRFEPAGHNRNHVRAPRLPLLLSQGATRRGSAAKPPSPAAAATTRAFIASANTNANANENANKNQNETATPSALSSCYQYAIALDTRCLDTSFGRDECEDFRTRVAHFLRSTARKRGFSACRVAWTSDGTTPNTNKTARTAAGASTVRRREPCSSSNNNSNGTGNGNSNGRTVRGVFNPANCSSCCSSIRIRSESIRDETALDEILASEVRGSSIRPPINHGNTNNRSVVRLPKGLMAKATWSIFGKLVEAICDDCSCTTRCTPRNDNASVAMPRHANDETIEPTATTTATATATATAIPLRIVIFTSHTSAFLDTSEEGHQRGIDAFWSRLQEQEQTRERSRTVQNIQIVVVTGETDVLVVDAGTNNGNDGEGTTPGSCASGASICGRQDSDAEHDDEDDENSKRAKRARNDIVQSINRYLERKAENDFDANRSRIRFDTEFVEGYSRVAIALSVVEHGPTDDGCGFWSLCQQWSRDACSRMLVVAANKAITTTESTNTRSSSSSSSASSSSYNPIVSFRLPETDEFDACELSFRACYKHVPFRLDSVWARRLFADLEWLGSGRAELEVLRLVPLESIDASLLYGVAIGLRAVVALPKNNEDEHEHEHEHDETVLLVQSLLTHLVDRDCALLIASTDTVGSNSLPSEAVQGLFHSPGEMQYFLFMPELVLSREGPASPGTAVLHRVASADHILEETETTPTDVWRTASLRPPSGLGNSNSSASPLSENPFSEYVEASLDRFPCSSWNPWFQDVLRTRKSVAGNNDVIAIHCREDRSAKDDENELVPSATPKSKPSIDDNNDDDDDDLAEGDRVWTDKSGVGSLVVRALATEDSDQTSGEGVDGSGGSAESENTNNRGATSNESERLSGDIEDSSETTDNMRRNHSSSETPNPPSTRRRDEIQANVEKDLASDSNPSDCTSLGSSSDHSDDSSSSTSSDAEFDYHDNNIVINNAMLYLIRSPTNAHSNKNKEISAFPSRLNIYKMKGTSVQQQRLSVSGLLLWLLVGSQSVLALTTNTNKATRRDFVNVAIIGTTAGLLDTSFPQVSLASETEDSNNQLPFCVIGANGKTGTKCVQDILNRGMPVRATSRGGIYYEAEGSETKNPLLTPTVCDVTLPSTIDSAVKGTRAVIFAASASKQGGTPSEVDNLGLKNVAEACIANKIPHLVIVSSGGVSKPDSPVYKFLNIFGKIMEEKIKGEDTIRAMYANLNKEDKDLQTLTYTIIRPGGLTEDPIRGVSEVELNQGDMKSGRISRYDVAKLCVEATFYPELTGSTTFECYDGDTGKGLGSVGVSNILKKKSDPSEFVTGKERRGDTYKTLFSGLERDA